MYSQGDIDVVLETKSQGDTDVVLEKSQGDTGVVFQGDTDVVFQGDTDVVSIKDNIKEKVKKSNLKVTHTFSDENVQGGNKSLIKVNSNELDLLTLFYTSIGKKIPDKKTKKFQNDVDWMRKLKRGSLFNKFPVYKKYHKQPFKVDEIKRIIELHALACQPEYESVNKKYFIMSFHGFLLNPHRTTQSYFIKWIEESPEFRGKPTKDDYPHITEAYLSLLSNGKPIPVKEMNKVIKASKRTADFLDAHRKKFKYPTDHFRLVKIIWKCLETNDRINVPISAGFLCSDLTYEKRLPKYCDMQALFKPPKQRIHAG